MSMGQIAYYKFLLLLSGVVAFAAYLTSLAPTITWAHGSADSGELVTAAYYLGVAHPTGYPAYVLLGWLFSHLPFGSIALRVNLLSAISASLAVAFVVMLVVQTQAQKAPNTLPTIVFRRPLVSPPEWKKLAQATKAAQISRPAFKNRKVAIAPRTPILTDRATS